MVSHRIGIPPSRVRSGRHPPPVFVDQDAIQAMRDDTNGQHDRYLDALADQAYQERDGVLATRLQPARTHTRSLSPLTARRGWQ